MLIKAGAEFANVGEPLNAEAAWWGSDGHRGAQFLAAINELLQQPDALKKGIAMMGTKDIRSEALSVLTTTAPEVDHRRRYDRQPEGTSG